jgi:putative aldouronate transport system substrate-binding protein
LNWDDHKDKLPNVYNNLPLAVQYRRDNMSAGTGGLYSLGGDYTPDVATTGQENLGPYLRWDYYKELGMPVLNEIEDYLPLLKRMQDAHPVNEAGQRVYGISMFTDWGNSPLSMADFYGTWVTHNTEIDMVKNTMKSILDNDSSFKRSLQFYFNANQLGILDPDSITQGYNDMLAKGKAGRVLFSWWPWGTPGEFRTPEREAAGIGYRLVPFTNEKVYGTTVSAKPVSDSRSWVISKNTKHLDKALAFIDFMYSYDGIWLIQNGRRGGKWDLDENGEPYLTRLGVDIQYNGAAFPTGGTQGEAGGIMPGLHWRSVHPVYGRQINTVDWIKKDFAPTESALEADWKRIMNARDDVDYFTQHNMLAVPPFAPMDPAPDNIALIINRVNEVVVPLSWQMAYARDQAEFDRLWAEMVEQAKGRGLDTLVQWVRDAYARAKITGAKYVK